MAMRWTAPSLRNLPSKGLDCRGNGEPSTRMRVWMGLVVMRIRMKLSAGCGAVMVAAAVVGGAEDGGAGALVAAGGGEEAVGLSVAPRPGADGADGEKPIWPTTAAAA